jgi:hypothetical protein
MVAASQNAISERGSVAAYRPSARLRTSLSRLGVSIVVAMVALPFAPSVNATDPIINPPSLPS